MENETRQKTALVMVLYVMLSAMFTGFLFIIFHIIIFHSYPILGLPNRLVISQFCPDIRALDFFGISVFDRFTYLLFDFLPFSSINNANSHMEVLYKDNALNLSSQLNLEYLNTKTQPVNLIRYCKHN